MLTSYLAPLSSTTSPLSITRPDSTASGDTDLGWDAAVLLELSNTVRTALRISRIPKKDMDTLDRILEVMLVEEQSPQATELSVISHSRFDKLIEALVVTNKKDLDDHPQFADVVSKAISLQHMWQQRLKADYFSLDEDRLKKLMDNGALHDVAPEHGSRQVPQIWRVLEMTPMKDSDLKPGT
jgi:hypothetical protein